MKKLLFLGVMLFAFAANAQNLNDQLNSKRIMLPNGWSLSPAGRSVELGDLPLNIAVPIFSWGVQSRGNAVVNLLNKIDFNGSYFFET